MNFGALQSPSETVVFNIMAYQAGKLTKNMHSILEPNSEAVPTTIIMPQPDQKIIK